MRKKNKKDYKEVIYNDEWEIFERGVNYYNDNNFSNAISTWEIFSECCDHFDKTFIKSLIQTAKLNDIEGTSIKIRDIDNLIKILRPYSPEHFGINVSQLVASLSECKNKIQDSDNGGSINGLQGIKLAYSPPSNPDLDMEVMEICQMPDFLAGIELFNKGYYWEAHENWQELWRDQSGRGKLFTEAFVQLAEGCSFVKKGKTDTAIYLFGKVLKKFQEFKKVQCKISIPELINSTEIILEEIGSYRRNGHPVFKFTSKPVILLKRK